MELIMKILHLVIISMFVKYGTSLECIDCYSATDLNCIDLEYSERNNPQECRHWSNVRTVTTGHDDLLTDIQKIKEDYQYRTANLNCLKLVVWDGNTHNWTLTVRTCVNTEDFCELYRSEAINKRLLKIKHCSVCPDDGCNSSMGIHVIWMPVFILSGLFIIFLQS